MDFSKILQTILGIAPQGTSKQIANMTKKAIVRPTEDSGIVDTPQGRMPLSSVIPGQQWQNPDNRYSPNGYTQQRVDTPRMANNIGGLTLEQQKQNKRSRIIPTNLQPMQYLVGKNRQPMQDFETVLQQNRFNG